MKHTLSGLLIVMSLLCSLSSRAQERFLKIFDSGGGNQNLLGEEVSDIEELGNGNFLMTTLTLDPNSIIGATLQYYYNVFYINHKGEYISNRIISSASESIFSTSIEPLGENYLVMGYAFSEISRNNRIHKTIIDSTGNILSNDVFHLNKSTEIYNLVRSKDNGFFALGYTTLPGRIRKEILLLKLDEEGEQEWDTHYTIPPFNNLEPMQMSYGCVEDDDDNIYIVGDNIPYIYEAKGFVVKADNRGDEIKRVYFTNPISERQIVCIRDVFRDDSSLYVCGYRYNRDDLHSASALLIKLDLELNVIWRKQFPLYSAFMKMIKSDGKILAIGNFAHESLPTLTCLNMEGEIQWKKEYSFTNGNGSGWVGQQLSGIKQARDGGLLLYGYVFDETDDIDAILIKTDSVGCIDSNCENVGLQVFRNKRELQLYPNPASSHFFIHNSAHIISYEISDLLSKVIQKGKYVPDLPIEINQLDKGTYIVKCLLESGEYAFAKLAVRLAH